jgi:gas vesicle protein
MSEDGGEFGAFMAGFVIGGLVGAATALLMAPQSGAETRAQIAARSDELKRAGSEQIHHYSDVAGTTIRETSEQVQERARIVLDEGKSKLSPAHEKTKERVDEAASDIAESTTEEAENEETDA